jgi:flagellar protein FlaG
MTDRDFIARIVEPPGVQAYARGKATRGAQVAQPVSAPERAPTAAGAPGGAVDPEQLQKLLGEIRAEVQNVQRALQFSVDEESGATIVRIIDSQTKEVIRQIPTEEVLSIASRLRAAAGGLLLADTV